MRLSYTVIDTFSIEYWRDLEIWVRGHSRSLKMVPIESLGTVSYLHSIATMAIYLAVSTQYTNVTDIARLYRQRLCIASSGKNSVCDTVCHDQ